METFAIILTLTHLILLIYAFTAPTHNIQITSKFKIIYTIAATLLAPVTMAVVVGYMAINHERRLELISFFK